MAAAEPPAAEPNPFSFREFVRSKARSAEEPVLLSPRPASPPRAGLPGPLLGSPPLPGPAPPTEAEEDGDEAGWSGSYRPAAAEREHRAVSRREGGGAGAAPRERCYEEVSGDGRTDGEPLRRDAASAARCGRERLPQHPAVEQSCSAPELKAENAALRRRIRELQEISGTQADVLRKLERKLEENKLKEEKEAQDLEAMVQHVEQNLQLMTKRAVKAENTATKLKQENALLQVQLKNYKMENEALRSGQSASLAVVRQNADTALQNLLTVITNSQSSIKQLVSGAESLQLVADLLKSIDRISEVSEDGQ